MNPLELYHLMQSNSKLSDYLSDIYEQQTKLAEKAYFLQTIKNVQAFENFYQKYAHEIQGKQLKIKFFTDHHVFHDVEFTLLNQEKIKANFKQDFYSMKNNFECSYALDNDRY